MKVFNTESMCTPEKNYMVDITDKVAEIKRLVDAGKYFSINRARQYGKTTTMNALKRVLKEEYYVIALDFQDIDFDVFKTGGDFTQTFAQLILDEHEFSGTPIPEEYYNALEKIANTEPEKLKMHELFRVIRRWCMNTDKPIVLMIDEVDSAANNQVFLDFLAQLRSLYIKRQGDSKQKTLHSVILAGVTDIKHLKYKIGSTGADKENSPWNISAAFNIDMSLSAKGIKEMLEDYSSEHNIAINTQEMAECIYEYTRGYPFLVSRICQIIDKDLVPSKFASLSDAWSTNGFDETLKILMIEKTLSLILLMVS